MTIPSPSPGSVALVTGASSGIGRALARELAARGHDVVLVSRTRARLEELAAELGAKGVTAHVVPCDLADAEARDRLAAEVEALGVQVEILVNSAGVGVYRAFADADRADEIGQVRLDVEAVVDLMHRVLPPMVTRGRGAVINLASSAGFQPLPFNAGYAAAKSHTLLLSEAVHSELRGTGVTVTAVCPGPVPTEFQERNDVGFVSRMPKFTQASAERVARDALRAADRGRRSVVPGNLAVRLAFAPNRYVPNAIRIAAARRIMAVD